MPDDRAPSGPGPTDPTGDGTATDPSILTRQQLRQQQHGGKISRGWWYGAGGVALVVIGVVVALVMTSGKKTVAAKAVVPTTTTTTAVPAVVATCPLTGAPAPGGTVPARPALGVKIGNYSGDRPSTGLNQADIVFEEPVEGAITRLVAVFQCQGAALVGDLRSAREPDAGIMSQLSHPIFVHAGGINPVLALMSSSPLTEENILAGTGSDIIHPSGRVAPYSTFANTAALWALDPSDSSPPAPIFQYAATPPAGAVAGSGDSVHIPFSASSDVTWQWNATAGKYLRSYSGSPDKLLDGSQTAATNVVIMSVPTANGSWVENSQGGHEVDVTATGSGPLVVMEGGTAIVGTWARASLTQPATLTSSAGTPITLLPGNTWNELVPTGIAVTTAAAPAAPAPTTTAAKSTTAKSATAKNKP
jgi:Protein of unknown function (DUF3048) N-terminal domain/Protein of unknown function (DUF3048) C-terminal domain